MIISPCISDNNHTKCIARNYACVTILCPCLIKRGVEYYLRNEKIVWNLLGSSLYLNESKHKAFRAEIAEYITRKSPDVICTISPSASHSAKLALQDTEKARTIPLVVVLADHGKVPYFRIVPEAALTIVSNAQSKNSVVSQGLSASKVEAVGPLAHKKFEDIMKTSKEDLRNRLGKELHLPTADDTKVALLAGGSKGSKGLKPTLKALLRAEFTNLHLIVLPGTDEPLRQELQAIVDNNPRSSAIILGYADNMHELNRLSDFAITKAGGSSESQFLITRTPNIINDCVSLYEKLNRNYVKSTKSGYVAESPDRVVNVVRNILKNPEQLNEIIAVQQKIAPHGGATRAAELLRDCASRRMLQQGIYATTEVSKASPESGDFPPPTGASLRAPATEIASLRAESPGVGSIAAVLPDTFQETALRSSESVQPEVSRAESQRRRVGFFSKASGSPKLDSDQSQQRRSIFKRWRGGR